MFLQFRGVFRTFRPVLWQTLTEFRPSFLELITYGSLIKGVGFEIDFNIVANQNYL